MDRLYRIRHGTADTPYVSGDCNVCYQRHVKVRPLLCGQHNYCRMCVEFVPRLANGDTTCRVCPERAGREAERRDHLDRLISHQTGISRAGNDVAVSIDGDEIIDFEGDSDEAEFDGNNTEWDELLKSFPDPTPPQHHRACPGVSSQGNATTEYYNDSAVFDPQICIPRKQSRLRLVLPADDSATLRYAETSSTSKQPISNNVTELINSAKYPTLPPYIPRKNPEDITGSSSESCASSGSSASLKELVAPPIRGKMIQSSSGDSFDSDPSEMERCTSPVKVPRKTGEFLRRGRHPASPGDPELARLEEEIGDIEGPATSTDSSEGSVAARCDDRDLFWEF